MEVTKEKETEKQGQEGKEPGINPAINEGLPATEDLTGWRDYGARLHCSINECLEPR